MVKQIKIDENNIVVCVSVGGFLEEGINVDNIPDEVMLCPQKWKYEQGRFTKNEDYKEPAYAPELTAEDLALAIAELAEIISGR